MNFKTGTRPPLFFVVSLAPGDQASEWAADGDADRVVTLKWASASGRRWGRMSLGLGLDAIALAFKARLRIRRHDVALATNPWIAAALRVLGHRNTISLGVYSAPGSRGWRILRVLLGSASTIVMSKVERDNWVAAGGKAHFIRYGNTFDYPVRLESPAESTQPEIFIGGTSDRDQQAISELSEQVLSSEHAVTLTIAAGGPPSHEIVGSNVVRRLDLVSQDEFGRLLARATVAYLPLVEGRRSAGHMFTVGALQVGTPVVVSETEGMREYVDGEYCREIVRSESVLERILDAVQNAPSREATHEFWENHYSRAAFVRAVCAHVSAIPRA